MYKDYVNIFAKNKQKNKIESLIEIIRIYYQEKGKEFGIKKFTMFIMKKILKNDRIEQPNEKRVRTLGENKNN